MGSPSATRWAPGRSSPSSTSVRAPASKPATCRPRKCIGARSWARPVAVSLYAVSLALNIVFTRAWATHIGPGMAAALDYCMRGVGVPLAFLVSPISNSLLPEIARLRSQLRLREAFRLIDRTLGLAALAAVGGMRRRAGPAPTRHRHPVSARQLHRGIHPPGFDRFPGPGAQPDRLEPAGIDRTRAVRARSPRAGVERFVYPGAGQRGPDAVAALARNRSGSAWERRWD